MASGHGVSEMTNVDATVTSPPPALAAAERYRAAERKLWAHYGLRPSERFVELPPLGISMLARRMRPWPALLAPFCVQ